MFASLRDCVPLIKWSRHLESPQDLLTMFDEEVEGYLKDKVLDPLCRAVEEDLRLSSHLHLQLDDRNPYKVCVCVLHRGYLHVHSSKLLWLLVPGSSS